MPPVNYPIETSNMKILTENWDDHDEDGLVNRNAFETFNKVEEYKSRHNKKNSFETVRIIVK